MRELRTVTRNWIRVIARGLMPGCVLLASGLCSAQSLWMSSASNRSMASAPPAAQAGQVLKTIDDPHTGARWLLVRQTGHPEWPGLLIQAASSSEARPARAPKVLQAEWAVRTGERITVHESTPVLEAWLEAATLGNAQAGEELLARLKIGGRLVRVRILAPGVAEFVADAEVRR